MARAAFGFNNLVKTATLTAGNQTASQPISNLQTDQGVSGMRYRAPNMSGKTNIMNFNLDFSGVLQPFNVITLHRTNLTAAAFWQTIQCRTGGGSGAMVYQSPGTPLCSPINGQTAFLFPGTVMCDNIYLSVFDPGTDGNGNPDGYIEVGLSYMGPLWTPMRNIATDTGKSRKATVDEATGLSGAEFPTVRFQQRIAKVSHSSIDLSEITTLEAMNAQAARASNILFIPDPGAAASVISTDMVFGRMDPFDIDNTFASNLRQTFKTNVTERL